MASSPRITFLTHYTELYGANLSLLNLIDGLNGYGYRSHVIAPEDGDLLVELKRRGVPAARLPFEWWVSTQPSVTGSVERYQRNLQNVEAIQKQIAHWHTGIVYSNSSVFNIGAMAARALGLPHVWHLREYGDRDYDLHPDFGHLIHRREFESANAINFVSNALRRYFLGDSPPTHSEVIYNGVARAAKFDELRKASATLTNRTQPFTFVLVGRFRESKGQAIAIRAFAKVAERVPNVRLLLVGGAGGTGDQAYFDGCRTLTDELKVVDRVEFWGYIRDPERAFLAADVALMCSRNEAMGRVTAEAMAACRPVIGYDSGGTSELIDHGRTGLLYRGEADALAGCMIRYAAAPEEAKQNGDAAWQTARERHTTEAYAERIHAVLSRITKSAPPRKPT
jgi:glycosyltransferase involved in cell wall biosynthesis